ncbi:MAG: ATP-binding protein [Crinalium sp.]
MLIPTPSLKEFLQPVRVCLQNAPLEAVIELFTSYECDRIIVVNEQQYPVGVVNLRRLMPCILGNIKPQAEISTSVIDEQTHRGDRCNILFNQGNYLGDRTQVNLLEKTQHPAPQLADFSRLMEPVEILSADNSLHEFWLSLQNQEAEGLNQHWVVVDSDGLCIGLLDSWRLLKYLAPLVNSSSQFSPTSTTFSNHSQQQETIVNPLEQLLEQLPLPMMLQTGSGQVISKNTAWLHQIDDKQDLDCGKPETADVFKFLVPTESLTGEKNADLNNHFFATKSPPVYYINPDNQNTKNDEQQANINKSLLLNLAVADPTNSCETLEIKPIKVTDDFSNESQQERQIWEFVKIQLGKKVSGEQFANNYFSSSPDLWLVLATDVTEQQQVAKELVAKNADLVQLNRFKDEFLACISHELKTPLTAVLGLSSLLKDQMLGELNERQSRYINLINQSGRQLMVVVNDILDLTLMETGQLELNLAPVDIATVCQSAYLQAQQLQSVKKTQDKSDTEVKFTLLIEPGLEMLAADELRLRQILLHLLSNALKFTEDKGEIGLNVCAWSGWISFTVWDTGIGIPPEKQHLIFQKFQQLENPLTRRFEGTGLGLVLAQRLARLHGGDISFISQLDQGSQFTLLLPPIPPQSSAELSIQYQNNSQVGRSNSNRLVLIVETVANYIEDLKEKLTSLGYLVVIGRSGTEAIEKARMLQPCAVLLNPVLPMLSAWDVLTLLKSDEQTKHIPVVVTASRSDKETALENLADDFLSIPIETSALRQSLINLSQDKLCDRDPIVILHLTSELQTQELELNLISNLNLSHHHSELNYRVLEADDLEQAELIARVWHPDVVLLNSTGLTDPLLYLQQLSQYTSIATLPLITIDHQATEAANQVPGLTVFPCLAPVNNHEQAALLQVIQVAVGMCYQPSIVVVDTAKLSNLSASKNSGEWLQALNQYLKTAGFRTIVPPSGAEVTRHVHNQNFDLLLIYLTDIEPEPEFVNAIASLLQQPQMPPILVLDNRKGKPVNLSKTTNSLAKFEAVLKTAASKIMRVDTLSMTELLKLIKQMLVQNC